MTEGITAFEVRNMRAAEAVVIRSADISWDLSIIPSVGIDGVGKRSTRWIRGGSL